MMMSFDLCIGFESPRLGVPACLYDHGNLRRNSCVLQ
jgi:hypothetical protein